MKVPTPLAQVGWGEQGRPMLPDKDPSASICREAYYPGRVQGVGFRYTTQSIAERHAVTGYVENLPDGRVHLEVEGRREEVDRFLDELKRTMARYIASVSVDSGLAGGRWTDFFIRH
jgi:acylphosphatase